MGAQHVEPLRGQIDPRLEVVVVVFRDRQHGRRRSARSFFTVATMSPVAKRDVLHAGAEIMREEARRQRLLALRGVERDAQAPVRGLHHLAAHDAARIDDVKLRRLGDVEQRIVEQEPGQHFLVMHRLRNVVDRRSGPRRRCPRGCGLGAAKSMSHSRPSSLFGIDEIDRLPPSPRTAGISSSPGPTAWRNGVSRSFSARSSVAAASSTLRHMAQTEGAVRDLVGVRKALLVAVEHEVDRALRPVRHRFGACARRSCGSPAPRTAGRARSPRGSSAANSRNSMPRHFARGGICGAARAGMPARPRIWSIR